MTPLKKYILTAESAEVAEFIQFSLRPLRSRR
jgi:hypothetical protein